MDDPGPRDDRLPRMTGTPPGEASRRLARRLGRVESRNVTYLGPEFPVFWQRARGSNVWDADGNRYVDLTAGFGVAATGHRHPRVEAALRRASGRLVHAMGDVHPAAEKVELLERLAELVPFDEARGVLTTSGSEAVEVALKTARLHTGSPGVLAFTGGYHGLSYGALSVTDGARFREPFEEQLNPHVVRSEFPHPFRPPDALAGADDLARAALDRAEARLDTEPGRRVGAVIVEPMQGRGGEVVPPRGFLSGLEALCRRRGLLLILDEIYTGFGRTGRRFACEAEDVTPDLLCVGKGFSGGMPLAGCLGRRAVMEAWPASEGEAMHTTTFLGHPLSCAAATAALDVIEEDALARRSRELGEAWRDALAATFAHRGAVGDVRGWGLAVGLDLVRDDGRAPDGELAARAVREGLRRGWILLAGGPSGNVLSLSPPLTVSREVLDASADALGRILDEAGG